MVMPDWQEPTVLRIFFPDTALQPKETAHWLVGWMGVHSLPARCAGRSHRLVSVVVVALFSQSAGKFSTGRVGCMQRAANAVQNGMQWGCCILCSAAMHTTSADPLLDMRAERPAESCRG